MTFYFRFSPSAVAVHLSFDQTYGQNQLQSELWGRQTTSRMKKKRKNKHIYGNLFIELMKPIDNSNNKNSNKSREKKGLSDGVPQVGLPPPQPPILHRWWLVSLVQFRQTVVSFFSFPVIFQYCSCATALGFGRGELCATGGVEMIATACYIYYINMRTSSKEIVFICLRIVCSMKVPYK